MEAKLLELRPVKTYIDKNHLDEPIKGKLLVDFISDMTGRKNRTDSYKSQYNVLAKHIREFSAKNNSVIYTNSITEEFLEDFIYYLKDLGMRNNTVKGLIEKAKAITKKLEIMGSLLIGHLMKFRYRKRTHVQSLYP